MKRRSKRRAPIKDFFEVVDVKPIMIDGIESYDVTLKISDDVNLALLERLTKKGGLSFENELMFREMRRG